MDRPWINWPIKDCLDTLEPIPPSIYCIKPHPYESLGAPYGENDNPWMLRKDVIDRLLLAQKFLFTETKIYKLAIFDAWRPLSVQSFMIDYSINYECRTRGLNAESDIQIVREDVAKFWAPPSSDPTKPPPHSTGGAVDICFLDSDYNLVNMGGEIDCIDEVSKPSYYSQLAFDKPSSDEYVWNERRKILTDIMHLAGFVQHPSEWWHFSYGDQMWAYFVNSPIAIYGRWDSNVSKLYTS